MPAKRFVILEHTYHGVHFDLMLEVEGKLRTWRLASPPVAGDVQRVEASFDHRLAYLDYEGAISGDRGAVRLWDRGVYAGDAGGDAAVVVVLTGERLVGRLTLQRVAGSDWEVCFTPEERLAGSTDS